MQLPCRGDILDVSLGNPGRAASFARPRSASSDAPPGAIGGYRPRRSGRKGSMRLRGSCGPVRGSASSSSVVPPVRRSRAHRARRVLPLGRPGVLLGVPMALCCQLAAAAPAHPASRGRRAPRPGRPAPRPAGVRQGRHLPLQGARGRHLAEPVRARSRGGGAPGGGGGGGGGGGSGNWTFLGSATGGGSAGGAGGGGGGGGAALACTAVPVTPGMRLVVIVGRGGVPEGRSGDGGAGGGGGAAGATLRPAEPGGAGTAGSVGARPRNGGDTFVRVHNGSAITGSSGAGTEA